MGTKKGGTMIGDQTVLKKRIATLEWDLQNIANEELKSRKQRELDELKKEYNKVRAVC